MLQRFIHSLALVAVLFLTSSFSSRSLPFGVKTIVIDAGHGGKDPGCHGKKHLEKDVALSVALKFGKYIQDNFPDVKVVYTRKTDVFVELQERANIANKAKADLFISIHCNSACVRDARTKKDICRETTSGAETYVMATKNEQGNAGVAKRENSAMLLEDDYVTKYEGFDPDSDESYIIMTMLTNAFVDNSLSFASKIQKQYSQKVGRVDRGVKRASLWVLWRTSMPSVLTEIGYLTNPDEELFLGSEKGQVQVAAGLFRAFRQYKDELEGVSRAYNDDFEKQELYKPAPKDTSGVPKDTAKPYGGKKSGTELKKDEPETKPVEKPAVPTKETPKKDSVIKIPSPANTKKDVVADDKKIKIPSQKDSIKNAQAKKQTTAQPGIVIYRVQVITSDKKLNLNELPLKELDAPAEFIENGVYKYTSGEFTKVDDAIKYKNTLRVKGFKDAFVIATKDGKRITNK